MNDIQSTATTGQRLYSLGYLSSLMQTPAGLLRDMMAQCGIEPALQLNNTVYLDGPGLDKLKEQFAPLGTRTPLGT